METCTEENSPEAERTLTCEEAARGGSDSGVEAGGQADGYASGFDSLIGGAASTSCESSLLSFSGDLENVVSGHEGPPRSGSGSSGRRTATPLSRRSPTTTSKSSSTCTTSRRSEQRGTTSKNTLSAKVPRRTEARSASRGRTPPVSIDDGRWPSVSIKPARRSNPPTTTTSSSSTSEKRAQRAASATPPEPRSNTLDKYGTLPRRTRLNVSLQAPPVTENREPSLNRTASLRRQRITNSGASSGYKSDAEDAAGSSVRSKSLTRTLPPYPVRRKRNMKDATAQTNKILHSREELEARLERLDLEHAKSLAALELAEQSLQTERSQREILQSETERVASRIAVILHGDGAVPRSEWLAELETRLSATSEVAARNQKDLLKAQRLNRSLSEEVEKARSVALTARQQLVDSEEEATELQEFLVAEKVTLAESLREAEEKIASLSALLEEKDKSIERHQDECRHLVRLSEKRKQEAETLKAKVSSTERLLVSQGGCTTAASVALAGLCSRLESLLPQLNSPQEEIEVVFNESCTSNVKSSPENKQKTGSPNVAETEDEEVLSQVRSPPGMHVEEEEHKLTCSPSLNDLTQAIISCHNCQNQQSDNHSNASLTDQASELDNLVSKLLATFQSLIQQREQSLQDLNQYKKKFDSEHMALLEANIQLEGNSRRIRQLETAQRIAQQSDESQTLRDRLNEKERQLVEMNNKVAANRQLLLKNWTQAADELRRQYEAIDKALDVMHKEQSLVNQSPALVQLQRELEDTNFHCVTLPSPLPAEEMSSPSKSSTNGVTDLLQNLHLPETVNGTA